MADYEDLNYCTDITKLSSATCPEPDDLYTPKMDNFLSVLANEDDNSLKKSDSNTYETYEEKKKKPISL